MQPYNIEIFDRSYTFKQNFLANDIEYNFDYLSVMENVIVVPFNANVKKGDYLRIKNNEKTYYGVVSSLSVDEDLEGYTTIGYKPLISLFDCSIVFDVTQQGTSTLEQILANCITSNFISGGDSTQNINGLSVNTVSSTTSWTYYLISDFDTGNLTIVNLLELFQLALTKYGVVVNIIPDFEAHTLTCNIGTLSIGTFVIEADLPSVIDKNIVFNQNKSDVNKLVVFNKDDYYSTSITYYLHSDDTYDTTDSDRISPVVYAYETAESTTDKTFSQAALELANARFGNANKANNLIEIWIGKNDTMVNPTDMEVGQWATIIVNGVSYESMLTGYEIGENVKLTFGTVRLDLTKIIKEALK